MNYRDCLEYLTMLNFSVVCKTDGGRKRLYIHDNYDIRLDMKPFYFYAKNSETYTKTKKQALVDAVDYMLLKYPDIKQELDLKRNII